MTNTRRPSLHDAFDFGTDVQQAAKDFEIAQIWTQLERPVYNDRNRNSGAIQAEYGSCVMSASKRYHILPVLLPNCDCDCDHCTPV